MSSVPALPSTPPAVRTVDLDAWLDNRGTTSSANLAAGGFNIWSNTFPAEELPAPGGTVDVGGVPFRFPAAGAGERDNVRCAGQLVTLPAGRYDWLYLLAASERRSEDMVYLHYVDGSVDPEWLRVSDFWPETPPHFGERAGIACSRLHYPRHVQRRMRSGPAIRRARIPVPRETPLAALRLPDNPAIHIFALTLVDAVLPGTEPPNGERPNSELAGGRK
jgi:hypothetical protein